ncbi:hypothetical protein GCM10007862_13730 [Dyella lipolytica]|uniref:Uncharacterized protein n=1 Tax=Dyella lipolytica TaxID=1867835 RepID=A0ABW8IV57_9GAMM|nr:hypothetical protein [Dyella lipolytica]GLQ46322.1 hypothetical protein GCM10007862_13730 [Dyella lipolytica]
MSEISAFRLYVLRAAYALIAVGLALMVWPKLIQHTSEWALKDGDTFGLLAGIQVLAMLGVRYPVKMLPLLFFELTWKSIWLLTIALPLWRANQIDPGTADSIQACVFGVVISVIAIPWRYVWAKFVRESGDSWRWSTRSA